MAAALAHRGPDDEGIYVDPDHGASLAARRLAIIDVAGGHQPVRNEDGSIWAVLNGEIYNHAALRGMLRAHGHTFTSASDTEVLVHLFEEHGPAFVHALEGMYAIAIWERDARRLTLVRDRFGEKPLFYASRGRELVFASELTALRRGLVAEPALDVDSLDMFFLLGYVPGERTIFEDLRALPPASTLIWSADAPAPTVHTYWSMPARPRTTRVSREELVEEADGLLRAAVRSRLAADVSVGVFLSGGLDSALVASLAAGEVHGRLKTFTVSYDVGDVGEGDAARETARRLGADHREVVLRCGEVRERVPALIGALDQPNADPALVALHAVAELARGEVKVAVGGEGADELFGGYPRYRWVARADRLGQLIPESLARSAAALIRAAPTAERIGRLADVLEPAGFVERNVDWVTAGRRRIRSQLYGPRMAARAGAGRVLDSVLAPRAEDPTGDVAAYAMALDQRLYLPDDVLAKADRATMLASLEMRTPYLSRDLAEFTATVPAATHIHDGGKSLLRGIARRTAAVSGAGRAKRAFRVPMAQWLRGPLAAALDAQADTGSLVCEGWLDRRALRATIAAHHRGEDHAALLWPVLVAGLWLDQLRAPDASSAV